MLRIAIPTPTTADLDYNRRSWPSYAESVSAAGAEPVEIPLNLPHTGLQALAERCQGILLPGSPADVAPARYGQHLEEHTSPADPAREATDLFLLEHANLLQKPLLGICFGCQILNVSLGGTLLQDLATVPVNHPSARGVAVAHTVAVAPASLLASICDPDEAPERDGFLRLPVNSSHHQAVAIAGHEAHVSARCPDDRVVEAIEGIDPESHFVLAVQWHPERTTQSSATSRAIFARLVAEAGRWAAAH
jgi:putative glutamine amidotransferase